MANETYFYGQGPIDLAVITNNVTGPWVWIGDVSELTGAFAEETVAHRESYTGKKSKAREFGIQQDMTWSATLHSLSPENLARFTQGTTTTTAAGSVTGGTMPSGLVGGDMVSLANPGGYSLGITDSAGNPATLAPANYELDAGHGSLTLLSLPTTPAPTQPFKAAYQYAARTEVSFLSATSRPTVALRYRGINLAEGGAPVVLELYKLAPGLLQSLSLISSGTDVAGMQVSFSSLLDTRKPANGPLGQFGRLMQVG